MRMTEGGIEVLYEDNHLIALNKPAGLLTQPAPGVTGSLEEWTAQYIGTTRGKPGRVFLHAVHRLDRVVSGIALFACTDKALSRMNERMRAREIVRVYHAVVTGTLPDAQGNLVHFLRHSRKKSLVAGRNDPGAREAILDYRILARKYDLMLLEVTLHTGRYHQIRAQLSAVGCPVVGDLLYGSTARQEGPGIALHHRMMSFTHPVRMVPVRIEAGYPALWPFPL